MQIIIKEKFCRPSSSSSIQSFEGEFIAFRFVGNKLDVQYSGSEYPTSREAERKRTGTLVGTTDAFRIGQTILRVLSSSFSPRLSFKSLQRRRVLRDCARAADAPARKVLSLIRFKKDLSFSLSLSLCWLGERTTDGSRRESRRRVFRSPKASREYKCSPNKMTTRHWRKLRTKERKLGAAPDSAPPSRQKLSSLVVQVLENQGTETTRLAAT